METRNGASRPSDRIALAAAALVAAAFLSGSVTQAHALGDPANTPAPSEQRWLPWLPWGADLKEERR